MSPFKKLFFRLLPLLCLFILVTGSQTAYSQTQAWYCDGRLKLDLKVGTITEIISYKKKNGALPMAAFTKNKIKYKTENIVKFQMFNLKTGEQLTETREFYNVHSENSPAIKFLVGQKYLFEADTFRAEPQSKSSTEYFYIRPQSFTKPFADAGADIDFLGRTKGLSVFREVFGTDEGESVTAGIISGKFTELVKPVYPSDLKKTKVSESINVAVLVAENGGVIKAKALCAINSDLAAAAEQAALASKFSPTVRYGKPIKIKGIIVYNFNP